MRYFTIFQDKLHSVNIQDDQLGALSDTVQHFQNHPYSKPVLISIVRAVSVVESLNEL